MSVLFSTIFLEMIPIKQVAHDILLNAVFGGVILAIGVGFTLKWGASTGGLDIIAMVLSSQKDKPIGNYMFILNGIIIFTAGLFIRLGKSSLYACCPLHFDKSN